MSRQKKNVIPFKQQVNDSFGGGETFIRAKKCQEEAWIEFGHLQRDGGQVFHQFFQGPRLHLFHLIVIKQIFLMNKK